MLAFMDKGIDKEGVFSILEDYGLRLPEYYIGVVGAVVLSVFISRRSRGSPNGETS